MKEIRTNIPTHTGLQMVPNGFKGSLLTAGWLALTLSWIFCVWEAKKKTLCRWLKFFTYIFFANRDGRLQVGDELLQVNGESLEGSTGETVAKLLRAETHIIQLVIARQVSVKVLWYLWDWPKSVAYPRICFTRVPILSFSQLPEICFPIGGAPL